MATIYPFIEKFEVSPQIQSIASWSLQDTLTGAAVVLATYLAVVVKIIPTFMKNRPPYKLKNTLLTYNIFQVALSMYLTLIYMTYIIRHGVIIKRCAQGGDMQEIINRITPYFIAKHLDLLDTVFFALRKKDNQISFLHLFHHATMIIWIWLHIMYYPTAHFVSVGLLNSFVHVLMYAYYAISSLGPNYSKYIWWKKHLTKVQLVQFVLAITNLYIQQKLTPCPIPTFFYNYCMSVTCSFFVLFMNFYIRSYRI